MNTNLKTNIDVKNPKKGFEHNSRKEKIFSIIENEKNSTNYKIQKEIESAEELLNKKVSRENSKTNTKKKMYKFDFLDFEKLEENKEKNDLLTFQILEKDVKEKYKMSLKNYFQFEKKFYAHLIKEEDEYLEGFIAKVNDFSKKNEENSKVNNKKKSGKIFFMSNADIDGNCNYLKSVPFLCPYPECERRFYSLKNLEEHFH